MKKEKTNYQIFGSLFFLISMIKLTHKKENEILHRLLGNIALQMCGIVFLNRKFI